MKRSPGLWILLLFLFLGAIVFLILDTLDEGSNRVELLQAPQGKVAERVQISGLTALPLIEEQASKTSSDPVKTTIAPESLSPSKTKRFRGRVVDGTGQGIPNCQIKIDYDGAAYTRVQAVQDLEEDLRRLKEKSPEDKTPTLDFEDEEYPIFKAVTDNEGGFFIDLGIPLEDEPVLSIKPPAGFQSYHQSVLTPKDRDFGEITLWPACALSGKALDSFGLGLEEVPVILMTARDFQHYREKKILQGYLTAYCITKEDGQFQFENLRPGDYYLLAKSKAHIETQWPISLKARDNETTIYLNESRTLEITIKDSKNQPWDNVRVLLEKVNYWPLQDPHSIKAVSNKNGVARCFKLIHSEYILTVFVDGTTIFNDTISIDQELKTTRLSVAMPKLKTLSALVLDSNGELLKEGEVQLSYHGRGNPTDFYQQVTKTDENGRFEFQELLPGQYSLLIAPESIDLSESATMHKQKFAIPPDGPKSIQLPRIKLPKTYSMTLTVLSPDNQPMPGLVIRYQQDGRPLDQSIWPTETDSEGSVVLKELKPGPLQLHIYQRDRYIWNAKVDVLPIPSSQKSIYLSRVKGSLKIELTDHSGKRVGRGYVSLTLRHLNPEALEEDHSTIASSDTLIHNKGRVSFEQLPLGDCQVVYQYQRGLMWRYVFLNNVTIVAGPTKTLKIQLPQLD